MRKISCLTAFTMVTAFSIGAAAFAATAPGNNPSAATAAITQQKMTLDATANANNLKAIPGSHVVALNTGTQVAATANTPNEAAYLEPNAKITGNEVTANNITAKNSTGITTPTATAKNPDELNQPATRAGTNAIAASTTTANIAAMLPDDALNATNNTANLNSYAHLRTDGTITAANANALNNTLNIAALHDYNIGAGTANSLNNNTLTNTAALHYNAYNAGTAHLLKTGNAPDVIPNAYGASLKTVATTSPGAHVINATFKVNNANAWAGTSANIV